MTFRSSPAPAATLISAETLRVYLFPVTSSRIKFYECALQNVRRRINQHRNAVQSVFLGVSTGLGSQSAMKPINDQSVSKVIAGRDAHIYRQRSKMPTVVRSCWIKSGSETITTSVVLYVGHWLHAPGAWSRSDEKTSRCQSNSLMKDGR